VLVCGTATGVGKTWVACALARQLRGAGLRVEARKPSQSYEPGDGVPTDAELLAEATGERPGDICPPERSYPLAMAPPMAAEALGLAPLRTLDLAGSIEWGSHVAVGIVETVGGARSPLADDGDSVDYARAVKPDLVVLVADAGLGAIHAVRSVSPALGEWPLAVFLNRFDPAVELHLRNRDWLSVRDRLSVHTTLADIGRLLEPARSPREGS
jgi:dethiobiotin synthetase